MDTTVPSLGFDQGEEPKVPYVRLGLLAALGVMATVILMSMIWKPKYYAELMGAKVDENIASKNGLTFVSAEVEEDRIATLSATPSGVREGVRYLKFKVPNTSPTISPKQLSR